MMMLYVNTKYCSNIWISVRHKNSSRYISPSHLIITPAITVCPAHRCYNLAQIYPKKYKPCTRTTTLDPHYSDLAFLQMGSIQPAAKKKGLLLEESVAANFREEKCTMTLLDWNASIGGLPNTPCICVLEFNRNGRSFSSVLT